MATAARVLIADDDCRAREPLRNRFVALGWEADVAETCAQALEAVASRQPTLVIVEQYLKDGPAINLLDAIKRLRPEVQALMVTRAPSIAGAVQAIRIGYRDYLPKPLSWPCIQRLLQQPVSANETADAGSASAALSLARCEWEYIHAVLANCDENVSAAARLLRIPRRSLQRKLRRIAPC